MWRGSVKESSRLYCRKYPFKSLFESISLRDFQQENRNKEERRNWYRSRFSKKPYKNALWIYYE